jgi:translation initiation factor IF-2
MAVASNALIVSFRAPIPPAIRKFAAQKGVKISAYDIIYKLIDDLFDALSGMLEPELVEIDLGKFEVLKVFKASKTAGIIGGRVLSGVVEKGSGARIMRDGEAVGTAKIFRIQREQSVVDKVPVGTECGLSIDASIIPKEGDKLELFKQEERIRRLERQPSAAR